MTSDCGHVLCELIDSSCSIATGRSRGCTPGISSREIAPELLDEVRDLLSVIDPVAGGEESRTAAVRLAEIIRREAREDRHLLAHLRIEEPELAPALERLCTRRRAS